MNQILKILTLVSAIFLATSCTKPYYIEVEKIVDRYHHTTDTIAITEKVRDSILITQRGDTVFKDRWHTEYLDRWRVRVDSFIQHDTIPQSYPVERNLNAWQNFKIRFGGYSFILLLLLTVSFCIIKIKKGL